MKTLLLLEGESDCWTLWFAGYHALGFPGASTYRKLELWHVENFDRVIIIQEPDAAGATFAAGLSARLVELGFKGETLIAAMEGSGFKDPSDLHCDDPERFKERFEAVLAEAKPVVASNVRVLLSANAPFQIAEAFLKARAGRLHHWNGQWWVWNGTEYVERIEQDQRAELGRFIHYHVMLTAKNKKGEEVAVDPTSWHINNAFDALKTCVNLSAEIYPPTWLPETSPRPIESRSLVSVSNGLLELPTGDIRPHTPLWFNLHALPVAYKPSAKCPEWFTFLEQVWADEASRETLQEIFGYLLTSDMGQQKAFLIIGPPRSGKGTIGRVLATLLGPDAVTRPALADFGQQFGLEALIGKSLAIVSDARLDNTVAAGLLAERILAISGEDTINIARKYSASWDGPLAVRFLVLANELPRFQDASGALPKRFIVLRMTKSWLGSEDPGLFDRLRCELPGILNWAMEGWMRLQERGRFIQPTASAEIATELADNANPMAHFFEEACDFDPIQECSINQLYKHYLGWTKQYEMRALPVTLFGRVLRAARADLDFFRPHGGQRKVRGVCPKSWA